MRSPFLRMVWWQFYCLVPLYHYSHDLLQTYLLAKRGLYSRWVQEVAAFGKRFTLFYRKLRGQAARVRRCPGWAQSEDTRKIFTPGCESAQVVVGVKKNRPRCV